MREPNAYFTFLYFYCIFVNLRHKKTLPLIGKRLKIARAASGLSLRALSDKIGNLVSAQSISYYERDMATPGSDVLLALADALDVSLNYLVGDQDMTVERIDFRKKKITRKREVARVEATILHDLERYLAVEGILGMPGFDWDKPREAPYPVASDLREADRAAHLLRNAWNLGLDPVPNLTGILEEHGIKALSIDLTNNIAGLTARVRRANEDIVSVMVVNGKERGERQRFTIAHELGHLMLDVTPDIDEEKAAHRFAGAFLMPAEMVWAAIGKHRHAIGYSELFALKNLFGVSVQALAYRCKDLGVFNDTLFRNLFRDFSRRGWRSPPYEEPFPLPAEKPQRFERLCFRALSENAVSEPRAAELLGISVHELQRQVAEPP